MVPRAPARSIASHEKLARIVAACCAAWIREFFVIGGDRAQPAGPYISGGDVMPEIAELSSQSIAMGVAEYRECHPGVPDRQLLDSLLAKQDSAHRIVTQMCFSVPAIASYRARLASEGVTLPVWAGVAGPVPRAKLVSLAAKIGVGSSVRFISNKGPLPAAIAKWWPLPAVTSH